MHCNYLNIILMVGEPITVFLDFVHRTVYPGYIINEQKNVIQNLT